MEALTKHQQKVVKRIKELHAAGQPLNIDAIREREPELLAAAYTPKLFWGWLQALEASGLTYKDIRISLMAQVQCKICKGWYGALGIHIKTHGMDGDEYKKRFPGASLMSQQNRETKSFLSGKTSPLSILNWEVLWSREYVLDKAYAYQKKGFSLAPNKVLKYDINLYWAVSKFNGGWENLLIILGVDPSQVRRWCVKGYSKDDCIKLIQSDFKNGLPINRSSVARRYSALAQRSDKLFGSYDNMLKAAGFEPAKFRRKIKWRKLSKKELILSIRKRAKNNLPLNGSAIRLSESDILVLFYNGRRIFGSWKATIEAAGLDYFHIGNPRNRYRNEESVINSLQELHRRGIPLYCGDLKNSDDAEQRSLHYSICKFYVSFEKALEAAGLVPPAKRSRAKYSDKEDVVKEIKRRERERLPLNMQSLTGGVSGLDYTLWNKGRCLFGSWRAALDAAGLDSLKIYKRHIGLYPDVESVLGALREYHSNGLSLVATRFKTSDDAKQRSLYKATIKFFGGFKKAVEAADL